MNHDIYQEPLVSRYTSREMQELFSERFKFTHWRRCWVALAEAQHELGLAAVTADMVAELKAHVDDIDYDLARAKEREIRHDVMAHVFAYGQQCPLAEPIIHLGATSQFVVCNTDLLIQKRALALVKRSLIKVIANLADFAQNHKDLATLGFTHYQPAQPTTVGKRTTLYLQDLLMDLDYVEQLEGQIKARGAKGTVGTQATFIELFNGDHARVRELDRRVAEKIGFDQVFAVTGQTYPRKLDMKIAETLAGIAASAHKFAVDLRLLSNLKVQEEPFESKQVGSSAMAYKRNPMRSERICSLARYVIADALNPAMTASTQWLERTLDDSANRRIALPEAFLAVDAVLSLVINVTGGLVVNKAVIRRRLMEYLPFIATENLLMAAVKAGGDRQALHERIRVHSVAAGLDVKNQGVDNNLLARLASDSRVPFDQDELLGLVSNFQQFTGRAAEQTSEFLDEVVRPVLRKYSDLGGDIDASLQV